MCGLIGYQGSKIDKKKILDGFAKLRHRGPDNSESLSFDNAFLGFHRLSIMDLSDMGNQPFKIEDKSKYLLCNGEIYNHVELKNEFGVNYFKSESDCEVILPLILEYGLEIACQKLDAEFAFVFYDVEANTMMAARDPVGIRPLFYGIPKKGEIAFSSEAKALMGICKEIHPFPPGHYYDGKDFVCYKDMISQKEDFNLNIDRALVGIREKLIQGVKKRLHSDAPVSYLLSGGLDSSLVCAIAQNLSKKPIKTYSIGTEDDAIDNKYAQIVADYIGSDHTVVTFSKEEIISCLDDVIRHLETWDITTIRASIGMYLVCQYIKQNSSTKVLLTGEISDELFGYKYTDFAPNAVEFKLESKKRVKEIHQYDVLRADRCISAHSLEARVPFGDLDFVDFVMSIPSKLKMNNKGMGKYILRKAFEKMNLLPDSILYRDKAAFSDAVGHSMVDHLKAYAEIQITDEDYAQALNSFDSNKPISKEALLYRRIFEKHYPGQSHLIPGYWMPNKEWKNCDTNDPSARVLPNYGKSGL